TLLGVGRAPDVDANPAVPLLRCDRPRQRHQQPRQRRQGLRGAGHRRRDQYPDHQVLGGVVELVAPDRHLQGHRKAGDAGGNVAAAVAGGAGVLLLLRRRAAVSHASGSAQARITQQLGESRSAEPGGGQGMSFSSFSEFLAMGSHGAYVWSAYGISLAILALNVVLPILARRRYLQDEARRLRREKSK